MSASKISYYKKKWKCKKKIIVSKSNKGLKKSIIDGLNYVFENYEKAIILEDDCIPNKSFFLFCSLMLKNSTVIKIFLEFLVVILSK